MDEETWPMESWSCLPSGGEFSCGTVTCELCFSSPKGSVPLASHSKPGSISLYQVHWELFNSSFSYRSPNKSSLVAQLVKNPPATQEIQVQSLDWEDFLDKEMPTHSSNLAWEIPWTGEPGGLQSMRLQRAGPNWVTKPQPAPNMRIWVKTTPKNCRDP